MQAKKTSGLLVTLKKNREYGFVYRKGKSCGGHYMVLLCVFRKYGGLKAGFSVSKKVGNAVTRNRARRVMRAALSEVLCGDVGRYDIVLVARGLTPKLKSTKLVPVLKKLFKDAGLAV